MKKPHILILIAIVALGAFLRFYDITEIPLGLYPDEAMNGNNALEVLATGNFKIFYPENNGREGLFINLQTISLAIFGNEPWALRIVSALIGTLTILGLYLFTRELLLKFDFDNYRSRTSIGLLASFFLATSYWHVNFSRIGFRAILVPFFATFAMYFLLKGLRKGAILDLVLAGIFAGLGFHTYIAFRFMVFVFAVPIVWYIWRRKETAAACLPCAILLFIFIAFIAALPLGVYFAQHPAEFLNRAGDISIFSAASPVKEFGKSLISTLGMFFVRGDCNWRHTFNCQPALHPLIALFFILGLFFLIRSAKQYSLQAAILLAWFFALMLPAVLTREGLPHALRSIGMIPPVMILAAWGGTASWDWIRNWLAAQRSKFPQDAPQLHRIQKEFALLAVLILLTLPFMTYHAYFQRWAQHPQTYEAFDTSIWHLGQFLASTPQDITKHVVVNTKGVIVRGIPMPAETVMFASDSFTPEERTAKNIQYIAAADPSERGAAPDMIAVRPAEKTIIAFLDGSDSALIRAFQEKYPELKIRVPGDFVILQNY